VGVSRRLFLHHTLALGVTGVGAVAVAGCGTVAWPPGTRTARLGVLDSGVAPGAVSWEPFRAGLRERGWLEGSNLSLDWRFAGGAYERLPDLARDLVGLPVDLIAALDAAATRAAMQASASIPIVMTAVGDPVANGLVTSLARPGGNVTGVSNFTPRISAKRLEMLKEAAPAITRVAVLSNPANPSTSLQFGEIEEAAPRLSVRAALFPVASVDDLDSAFARADAWPADGLLVLGDALLNSLPTRIADNALARRWPSMALATTVPAGALMFYGASPADQMGRAAGYVDQILRGANPGELPVQQPIRFELGVNLRTADALGITFPPLLAAQVTDWIE
jgi:putative tryptophan/tyrosine transport system substrate-binding protein